MSWLFRRCNANPLYRSLGRLSGSWDYRVIDLMKSAACFGATGSGKSSGVARWLAEAIVRHPRSSLLIPCAKPDDVRVWRKYFADAGRAQDLVVFEPGGPRFNVLDYILKMGGDYRDVTRCLALGSETLRTGDGGTRDEYWEQQTERSLYNAVVLVHLATGRVGAPELQRFINGMATVPEDIYKPEWRQGYHNQIIKAAHDANKTAQQEADYQTAKDYFICELPAMNSRTRSSITVGTYGLLHQMNTGHVRELISSDTDITPLWMLEHGKSILINLLPADSGTSKIVNAFWKFATQWSVLRRDAKPTDFFNVIFVDEAPLFVNRGDADYLAQCRSHLGCMIYLAQSRHSYYAAMGGESGKHKADALLANFNLKIFNSLGDAETAQWASDLCGRELKTFYGSSMGPQEGGLYEAIWGQPKVSGNFSVHFEPVLEPKVFMHGLRTGSALNEYLIDAVLIKTGEPFAAGKNWMFTTFKQR